MPGASLRVLTWNLFHGRDGLRGLGPTWASLLLRRPVEDDTHVHLNRKLTDLMARRIASWAPDVCALQEVPTAGIRTLVDTTGMRAVWTTTGPLIGPARLRDALAARNPDLWRTHEGNANVLLVGPRLEVVDGHLRSRRLNPWPAVARAARDLRLSAGELARYLPEPRRIVLARLRAPGGAALVVGCVHCHNARHPEVVGREIALAAEIVREAAGDDPAVLAGDLNARPSHAAVAALSPGGLARGDPRRRGRDRPHPLPGAPGRGRSARAAARGARGDGRVGRAHPAAAPVRPRPRDRDPRARAPYGERIVSWATSSAITTTAAPAHRAARPRSAPSQSPSAHMSGNASRPKRAIDVIVPLERGSAMTAAE